MSDYHLVGVSVVMPAFNAERTIGQAIESVLSQTHSNFELIVVDDCSKDGTTAIVEEYIARDPRVRMIRNSQNSGVSVSRNTGVASAKYDWVAFLDSDDLWIRNKLQAQLAALSAHPECSICFTSTAYVNEKGERSEYILHAPQKVTAKEILMQNVISCSSVLAKRDALLSFPMLDNRNIHEDLATWVAILNQSPYAVGVDEPLLVYRISSSGKSGNKLKAARMQWNTYRVCRVPLHRSLRYFAIYTWRNVNKYRSVRNSY